MAFEKQSWRHSGRQGTPVNPAGGRGWLTHRGFFGVCPVYLGDLDGPAPLVVPRRAWLDPLLDLSAGAFAAINWLGTQCNPLWAPRWPVVVTGRLPAPLPCLEGERPRAGPGP